jgi:hypothetical protein
MNVFNLLTFPCINFTLIHDNIRVVKSWSFDIIVRIRLWNTSIMYKTILNSTQSKNKVYHKTNLNNNIKLSSVRDYIYRTKLFPEQSLLTHDRKRVERSAVGNYTLQSMFVNQQMVKRNSNGQIVIKSSDNDVLLLSLHFYSKMTSYW